MNGQHADTAPGHVFISYVREDRERVDRLQSILEEAGVKVWRDTADLWAGQDWKNEIRRAIMTGSLAFIACFSEHSEIKSASYQNEELILAAEQMRLRPPGRAWLIPVRFAECSLPDFDLGAGRTLHSLQRIDLFDGSWEYAMARLVGAVLRVLGGPPIPDARGPRDYVTPSRKPAAGIATSAISRAQTPRAHALDAESNLGDSFHIESHATLLQQPADAEVSRGALDAIVVPTIRPQSLQPATVLASDMGCALVVLCSTPGQAGQVLSECEPVGDDMLVTYVPRSIDDNLLSFLTSVHPENDIERSCHVDIARKRNVGLLLARLCGWRTIMYLDDDIRDLTASAVSRAAALTAHFQAAGFEINYYPDNSVVCHAHRLAGGKQGTFPGGSALVVDVARYNTLFPPVYNEDWLFLFDALQSRYVAVAGTLSQLEYQPFAHSRRAGSEEFGDVIAEGLYRLIHEGADVADATYAYWRSALERRFQLIDHIAARLLLRDGDKPVIGYALMSLAAARERLTGISALACVSFIHAWRAGLDAWRHRLLGFPVVGDLADAAMFLDLPAPDSCVNR